jgi:sulfur-carrier protein
LRSLEEDAVIRIRFFASLAERVGQREAVLAAEAGLTVAEVWSRVAGMPRPAALRCARNLDYCPWDAPVFEDDEIAFFPPVTGG